MSELTSTGAQAAAADPATSVWVAASAGTGKTHVLTNRVLRLLLAGSPPERILCLTFTRAAAAEMANRLNTRLGAWAVAEDSRLTRDIQTLLGRPPAAADILRARRLFAGVLDVPGGLKIQTIHAFCQSLLGRFPLEAGVATHFNLLDERSAAEMMQEAMGDVLSRARASVDETLAVALAGVTTFAVETVFGELMTDLARARGRLTQTLSAYGDLPGIIKALAARLGLKPGETDQTILAAACMETAFDRDALTVAAQALLGGGTKDKERGAAILAWLGVEDRAAVLDDYARAFLIRRDDTPRSHLATKAVAEKIPGGMDSLMAEAERLATVFANRRMVRVVAATQALLTIGFALLEVYARNKRSQANLDYDDLILFTRGLLEDAGAAPWVLYKLDGGLDHILIDEAQDTSPDQWRVVSALAEEFLAGEGAREARRTIFAVGDLKQSIFSFQGADPAAFDGMRRHFAERSRAADHSFSEIPLDLSFRSTAAVLQLVDTVFAAEAARDGLVLPDTVVHHEPFRQGAGGLVELWPTECPEVVEDTEPWSPPLHQRRSVSAEERLAGRIAEAVSAWVGTEVLVARGRPVRPGDIMILVRRRTEFVDAVVKALKARNVPVAGADRMVMTEQMAIMDLMALGRFALMPEDDLTLAVALKGPLVGLDEESLFDLAHDRKEHSLWRVLGRRRTENSGLGAAFDLLSGILAWADFMPPFEFFSRILVDQDGRRRIVARLGNEANDPIDEFLALALAFERLHPPSLQGFLHWVEAADSEIKRDMDQGRNEVRVLTVHAAKGLQAPIVILPDTTQIPVKSAPILHLSGDSGEGAQEAGGQTLPVWPARAANELGPCAEARAEVRRQQIQEYRRLLYVALTRAEDRLYICGWETLKGRAPGCWYDLVADGFARLSGAEQATNVLGESVQRLTCPQQAPVSGDPAGQGVEAPPSLPAWATRAAPLEPSPARPLAPSRPRAAEPAAHGPIFGPGEDARFRRGRLTHSLLEFLPDHPVGDRRSVARAYLGQMGLNPEQAAGLTDQILEIVEDPAQAPLFGPDSRAEVPVAGLIGDHAVYGRIDRLVVTDQKVLAVDYKTGRTPPSEPSGVPSAYLDQMAAYFEILGRIYPGRRIECALLWTDAPRLMTLPGEMLIDRLS